MRIALVRHGQAVSDVPRGRDEDRYLTASGRATTRRVGAALRGLGFEGATFLTSPLVRAVQTTELLADALGSDEIAVLVSLSIDFGSAADVVTTVRRMGGPGSLVLVTHEPKVRAIAAGLAGGREGPGFPTSGAALYERSGDSIVEVGRLDPVRLVLER